MIAQIDHVGHTKLLGVFKYLPAKCESIFIAGGAVVNLELASDIDIWFARSNKETALQFGAALPFWNPRVKVNPEYKATIMGESYIPSLGKVVQVMVTDKLNCKETMDNFDISTHCAAITSKGNIHYNTNYTHWEHHPVILKSTPSTFSRYIKICKRYGHVPQIGVMDDIIKGNYNKPKPTTLLEIEL